MYCGNSREKQKEKKVAVRSFLTDRSKRLGGEIKNRHAFENPFFDDGWCHPRSFGFFIDGPLGTDHSGCHGTYVQKDLQSRRSPVAGNSFPRARFVRSMLRKIGVVFAAKQIFRQCIFCNHFLLECRTHQHPPSADSTNPIRFCWSMTALAPVPGVLSGETHNPMYDLSCHEDSCSTKEGGEHPREMSLRGIGCFEHSSKTR